MKFWKMAALVLLVLLISAAVVHASPAENKRLMFFCGSAVKVPMEEILRSYREETGETITVTYGGSGTLLSQMELSRRGDLYLAGSPDYIEIGAKKGLLIPGSERRVVYLVPAIIVPKGNPAKIHQLKDLARPGVRIGLGNPESVCLGLYSVELLEANSLLEPVLKNVVVLAKSCEDTATLAVLRKVDAILGWDVFSALNPNEVEKIPLRSCRIPRISCITAALPVFVSGRKRAESFLSFLLSPKGMEILRKWGYLTRLEEALKEAPGATVGGSYRLPEAYFRGIRHE